ncbi:hypothetical protein U9M48_016331 [Paspalum notatum var. saurae]|uniref:Uncharacterized protein n=1 Tax=Paspalum notatum var. saurae TaxID=547442 RepID=A0AAQ3T794_PASNO
MAAVDLSKLVKEKRFWVASFLVAWAAALQGHMMWMQRQDAFKHKFGGLEQDEAAVLADGADGDASESESSSSSG